MRPLLFSALVLIASTASAQNMHQMNAAYQNQFNNAFQSAWTPYYAPRYYGGYRPYYGSPYGSSFQQRAMALEAENQTRQLRRMNRTLQFMEWDLQDAARR